jgi:hypothetical protein
VQTEKKLMSNFLQMLSFPGIHTQILASLKMLFKSIARSLAFLGQAEVLKASTETRPPDL